MPRTSTKMAPEFIGALAPFTTNGALAGDYDGAGNYVVKSYSTAIAVVSPAEGTAILNTARYSVTTSTHQNITEQATETLALDGYQIVRTPSPEVFTELTGYRGRVRGANLTGAN